MNEEMAKEIPNWESQYLDQEKKLTDREKEILKGDPIRSHEGMMYGRMYADWKRKRGWD
jgi:hypothetical protein|tara:strand:- start:289 stop:465 length:177 start_codon:yes stop_codon:yes gene_type:complete